MSIDFPAIKAAVSFEKAAAFLGIELKRDKEGYRCYCPGCDKDRVLFITPGKGWYCHNIKKGGDVIYMVAHCKDIKQSEAAKLLQEHLMRPEPVKRNSAKAPQRKSAPKRAKVRDSSKLVQSQPVSEELDQWEAFIGRL